MGFKFKTREIILEFEEPFEGLEIRCREDLTTDAYFDLIEDIDRLQRTEGDRESTRIALQMFCDRIALGWNAEDDAGEPIPLTAETLLTGVPVSLAIQLIPRWKQQMTGVSAPLGGESESGGPSQEEPASTAA